MPATRPLRYTCGDEAAQRRNTRRRSRGARGHTRAFLLILLILETLWARASLVVFVLSFDGMPDFKGSLLGLIDLQSPAFIVACLAVGGVFAALILAISVVAMPMILDCQTDAIIAALTMLAVVPHPARADAVPGGADHTAGRAGHGALVRGPAGKAPVPGHASWHAYRAAVTV